MAKKKTGKRPDTRPARQRYWTERHLPKNKVNNIIKSNSYGKGISRGEASGVWEENRKGRIKL